MPTGIAPLDHEIGAAVAWIDELTERLGARDRARVHRGLRAVLHGLRHHLPAEALAVLAAVLPGPLRGDLFEGWHPAVAPLPPPPREEFLAVVHGALDHDLALEPEALVRAIMAQLDAHLPPAEAADLLEALPPSLRMLWPRR
jgi:uncharacterized protein (DUF2267 family)